MFRLVLDRRADHAPTGTDSRASRNALSGLNLAQRFHQLDLLTVSQDTASSVPSV